MSPSKQLPLEEYRHFVSSFYADRTTMDLGAVAVALGILLTYASSGDGNLLYFLGAVIAAGVMRHVDAMHFASLGDEFAKADRHTVLYWERRYTLGGVITASSIGFWGFYIAVAMNNLFCLLVAVSAAMMSLVGVSGRNFASSRLVWSQSLALMVPILVGVLLEGGWLNFGLALLFVPCVVSAIFTAANIRTILAAVIATQGRARFNARHDPLTALPNRTYFRELVQAAAESGTHAVLVLDLDDFKAVNDTYGHQAGDRLLQEVSSRLRRNCGENAIISRHGGDEFVIFLPGMADERAVLDVASGISQALNTPFVFDSIVFHPFSSIGFVFQRGTDLDIDDLFVKADLALYAAKRGGKGSIRAFEDSMDKVNKRRQKIKSDLEHAIETGGLSVVYQPILNMANGRVSTCEALVRWTHPEFGPISPAEFIPLAEEMGCVGEITAFVLREATRACSTWLDHRCRVSVNLSAVDFRDPERLMADVRDALERADLPSDMLEVEVTETAIIADKSKAEAVLNTLRRDGVRVCLDDFGTGYANLTYMLRLPLDKLKIDRSFVERIEFDRSSQAIINGVSLIAKQIGMTVTVEGIETMKQLEAAINCAEIDEVQGWVYGKAMPAEKVANYIRHTAIHPKRKNGDATRMLTTTKATDAIM